MALVFDYKNIEIKFLSNKSIDKNSKQSLIVYPIIAHKIFAPVIDELQLNIFQKHILSILNKGNFSLDKISEWLSLDITLVKTIAVELANKELINIDTMDISSKGKDLIEGSFSWFNNIESLKKDIRYIFQDVFTQELYPVVLAFDNFQENVYLKEDELIIGSKGKKDSFPYSLINPENINLNSIRKPEIKEILESLKKYADVYIPNSKNDLKEVPNAVKYLGEEPSLFYCAMWVSNDKGSIKEDDLEISDPFNIYDTPFWLKDNVLEAQNKNEKLKDVIHNLVNNIEESEKEKVSEFMLKFDKELDKELNEIFDFTLKVEYPNLYSAIKEYFFEIKNFELHRDSSNLKDALVKSQIVLETLFTIIFDKHKEDYQNVLNSQTHNGNKFHVYKKEIITRILKINPNAKIPNWHYNEFNGIENALKNPNKASLRALFIASVMAASYYESNPIHNILKEKNNFPICIENIAKSRNKVGHKYIKVTEKEIEKFYNEVIIIQNDIKEIITIFLKS
ncbi:hypothetical protein PG910_08830 [Tenacibaculum dicentrarchi]|nr:hypothetical protein PG910_08830 [Tenacibaculum dicentrarchi]